VAHKPQIGGILDEDHVRDVLEHRVEKGVGLAQRVGRTLALGDCGHEPAVTPEREGPEKPEGQ